MEWFLLALIAILAVALIYLFWRYAELHSQVETRARKLFSQWQKQERKALHQWQTTTLETHAQQKARLLFEAWRQEAEKAIREDAIRKSESVIQGKITEHLIPFFPSFPYNPRDARFMGTPVDFVVFDGLSEGKMRQIVFIEVKSGKAPTLSKRERQVRKCIEEKNVTYEIIHHRE